MSISLIIIVLSYRSHCTKTSLDQPNFINFIFHFLWLSILFLHNTHIFMASFFLLQQTVSLDAICYASTNKVNFHISVAPDQFCYLSRLIQVGQTEVEKPI